MPTSIYATFDDVNNAYEGTIPTADRGRVEHLISQASSRITAIVPSVPLRLQTGDLDFQLPAGLVIEAVLRVYRNPEGVTAEEIGPFHKMFNQRAVSSEVTLDEAEVHRYLDPVPSYARPSIRVAMPTMAQVIYEVGGVSWPPPDQYLFDFTGLTDSCTAVKT